MTYNLGRAASMDLQVEDVMNIELRDYFAAHAPSPQQPMELAEHCAYRYRYADAMLAAREAGKPGKKADDGWIEWNGGECPVDAGVAVEIKFHGSSCTYLSAQPTKLPWPHIAAYRVQPS